MLFLQSQGKALATDRKNQTAARPERALCDRRYMGNGEDEKNCPGAGCVLPGDLLVRIGIRGTAGGAGYSAAGAGARLAGTVQHRRKTDLGAKCIHPAVRRGTGTNQWGELLDFGHTELPVGGRGSLLGAPSDPTHSNPHAGRTPL